MVTLVARHVVVSGRVQGVGFRYLLEREATVAGVAGWTRNTAEGTVEAVLEGPPSGVEDVLGWMRRGPRGAVVVSVDVTEVAPRGLTGFMIR
ncbi:acylphosphatase [Promicromonospora soli]|uniref:acylphosphatase n=1 Tax=Promicromonospora soli TaxID=2035533 RepID=A0A919FMZ0_9MICO|nr:acylphosphatase [Promicromonospora soli]GHH68734.1 acylphosphatase [Promicromonospora soli]